MGRQPARGLFVQPAGVRGVRWHRRRRRTALGDLHLWAPLAIAPASKDGGFALSAIPYLHLPTGAAARYLGNRGPGGGVWLSAGYETGALAFGASAAGSWRPTSVYSFGTVKGGPWGTIGGSAAYRLSDALSFGAEVQLRTALFSAPPAVGLPSEALITARWRSAGGLWLTAGAGPGLIAGLGSPGFRAFVGVGWHGAHEDTTITPVAAASGVAVHVVDGDGGAIRSAEILAGGTVAARADATGTAILPADVRWKRGVVARAPGYVDVPVGEPAAEVKAVDVALAWAPVALLLRVTDQEGQPVPAEVAITGPKPFDPPTAADDGRQRWLLGDGTWTVAITAPGLAGQTREIVVPKARTEALLVDAVLAPEDGGTAGIDLVITDPTGQAVEGAEVAVDGRPIGTTSTGGRIAVSGLADGKHAISVGSDVLDGVEKSDVVLHSGKTEALAVAMPFRTGSVVVTAKGPEGRVVDALVRFEGPSTLPPLPLGADGQRVFVLRPGTWRMLVSSSALGAQQREVVIPEDSSAPVEVEVVLQAEARGAGELRMTLVDREGEPVDRAEVVIDGDSYGTTSTGGTLVLEGLDVGKHDISIRGDRFVPVDLGSVAIVDGYQERLVPLSYKPGTVRITARTSTGDPVDAAIRVAGPGQVAGKLGTTGRAFFQLSPGSWQMLASSDVAGFQTRTIDVPADPAALIKVDLVMNPAGVGNAGLRLAVVDPDGRPISGAEVLVDGESLGETSTNGIVEATGLVAGTHRIDVRSDAWAPIAFETYKLNDGDTARLDAKAAYAPGTVRIAVRGPDGPLSDAIVRLSGPVAMRPKSVDSAGIRQFVLAPGDWQVLVSSTSGGMAQRELTIAADQVDPRTETVLLAPGGSDGASGGTAVLLVRVRDPSGAPVVGAQVTLDGVAKGTTGRSGAVLISDLVPGTVNLEVAADAYRASVPLPVELTAGSVERFTTLVPVPIDVDVVTRGPDGKPMDARLSFDGPMQRPAVQVGADGFETVGLPPGHWEVFATAPGLGVKRATLDLTIGGKTPRILFDLEPARIEIGAHTVQIEQVHFDLAKTTLSVQQDQVLTEVAATLLSRPDLLRVEVQGHPTRAAVSPTTCSSPSSARSSCARPSSRRACPPSV